jgi:hypothetical protein
MDSLKRTLQKKGLLDPNSSSNLNPLSNERFNTSKDVSLKNSKNKDDFAQTEDYVRKQDFKALRNQLNELKNTLGASKFNLDASRRDILPNKTSENDIRNEQTLNPDKLLAKQLSDIEDQIE